MREDILAKILRTIADSIEMLDESQLEVFARELERFKSVRQSESGSGAKKNRHSKIDVVELEQVLRHLNELQTRQEGAELLDRQDFSRKELEKLAKLRNIHVSKVDNVAKIKEKLVEVIIGSRLSSRAIRGG